MLSDEEFQAEKRRILDEPRDAISTASCKERRRIIAFGIVALVVGLLLALLLFGGFRGTEVERSAEAVTANERPKPEEVPTASPPSYSDLQRQVAIATGLQGNATYDLVKSTHSDLIESDFADATAAALRSGRFLLLIAGDGIREDVGAMAELINSNAALGFSFGLVEVQKAVTRADGLHPLWS